uniref:MOM1 alpha-helical domain-containing protein n=2 Tax=Populus trichocarpa TaxID=3694 RepID=A0A2K2AY39_POPTR
MKDVIQEFLTIVTQKGKDKNLINSIILNVKQNQGSYTTNLPLHGEPKIQLLDEELPHVFWERLLKGKQPQWKYSSGLFQRNRKRVQYFDDIQKNPEVEADEVVKKRKKVAIDNSNSPSLKAAPIGTSGAPVCSMSQFMPSSTGCLTTTDANHVSNFTHLNNKLSLLPKANTVDYNERMNLHYSRKSLHLVLKPEIEKLSEILQLPEDVKVMVDQFLEYVLNNHHVSREPASILQAFLISLCWTAASMIKYKLDRKESLALAKQHLNFCCTKDEADFVYSKLRYLKKVFLYHTGNFKLAGSPKAAEFSTKDLSTNQSNGRPSLSTPSNMQKVRIEVENLRPSQEFFIDQALSHLGLTQKDYSENIEEKCDEQMNKLLQRQREEREELKKKYEEEKAELELMQRTEAAVIHLHSNSSMRTDKLKVLDNVFAKEFRELKRKMEIRLNNVLEFQLATRNKLQERKAHWIGVKLSGLLNKPLADESGYDQQNAATLNSCSKEQTSERAQSMPDGEVLLEALETVSLNEDVFSGVLSASEPMFDGASSSMLDREVPLEMPQTASVRNVSENIVYLNASSGEGQIPVTQVAVRVLEAISSSDGPENTIHKSSSESRNRDALMVPDSEFPLGVTEIVSSTGGLENAASANPSPSEGCTVRTTSCMDGREVLLEVPETASLEAEHGNRVMEKDGISAMVSDNATEEDQQNGLVSMLNQDSQSDNIIAVNQQNGEVLLGVPQTNEVGLQDEEVPSGVHGTPVEGSASNGGENTGVYVTAFSIGTGVDQLAGVLPSGGFETATSAELEGSRTQREIDSIHAVASDTSQSAESSRLQDGVAQVCDNQIAFQQVDASASQPLVVASGQSPNDASVTEHLLELLLSTGSPTPSGSQPATSFAQLSPIDSIAVGGSGMHISNMRAAPVTPGISNRPGTALAVRMPVSMSQDPLQNELDRLSKETEEIIKIHEDTKLQLKSDCEKEIVEVVAQIHKKHDIKLQEIESDFQCKKKEMNDNQNKVLMNKILAEAFKTKCMDSRASSTLGKQQEITSSAVQQLLRQSQPTAQRPPIVASSGVSADGHQTSPSLSPPSPPLEVVRCSSLLSGTPTRPPHIGSISPITNNLQLGSGIRAPAPHLQPFRPSASISTTGLSSFLHGMPSQQVPSTSPTLSEIPSRAPASVQQSGPQTTTNCCESMGVSPSSTYLSGLDSLMDGGYQTSTNATQPCSFPPVTNLISNPNQLTQPELGMLHSVNSVLTNPSSEVCLSDDD